MNQVKKGNIVTEKASSYLIDMAVWVWVHGDEGT